MIIILEVWLEQGIGLGYLGCPLDADSVPLRTIDDGVPCLGIHFAVKGPAPVSGSGRQVIDMLVDTGVATAFACVGQVMKAVRETRHPGEHTSATRARPGLVAIPENDF